MKTGNRRPGEINKENDTTVQMGIRDKMNSGARHIPKETRREDIRREIPVVSSVPSGVPKTQRDIMKLYINGATYRLYIYDAANGTWRYATLT